MAAWYVFSALGIYPIPGSDQYVVGAPQFPRADIRIGSGVFSIVAHDVSTKNIYIQSAEAERPAVERCAPPSSPT